MSVLRRSHDHHRDLRARLDATPSANRSDDQDRQIMTPLAPRSRKLARSPRWCSTGHAGARPNARLSRQIAQERAPFGTASRSPMSRSAAAPQANLAHRLVRDRTHHPRQSNPHSARRVTHVSLPAVSSLGGFPTPAARAGRAVRQRPASENLHKSDIMRVISR